MRYTLMLATGKIVEDEVELTFQLGEGEVIDGLWIVIRINAFSAGLLALDEQSKIRYL